MRSAASLEAVTDVAATDAQAPGQAPHGLTAFVRDRTTLVLYASLAVFGALQTVPSLAMPALRDELGYGYGLSSAHLSLFAIGSVAAGLVGAGLSRRYGRRVVLVVGLLGFATGALLLTAGRASWATLGACLVAGGIGTLVLIAVQAGLADHHGDQRAVAFAESNAMASVGTTAAPLLVGGLAALTGSWRWGVAVVALGAVAVAVAAGGTRIPEPHAEQARPCGARLPRAAVAGIALVFSGVVLEWSVSFWGATYLRDVVGLSRPTAVTSMSLFFGAMLTGRVVGAVLARRVTAERLLVAALATCAAGLVAATASTSTATSLSALVLLGLGISVLFPLGLSLAVAAAPDQAARVSGRCVTAGSVAVLLGPLVVGRLADVVGLRQALLVLPLTALAAVPLLRAARP